MGYVILCVSLLVPSKSARSLLQPRMPLLNAATKTFFEISRLGVSYRLSISFIDIPISCGLFNSFAGSPRSRAFLKCKEIKSTSFPQPSKRTLLSRRGTAWVLRHLFSANMLHFLLSFIRVCTHLRHMKSFLTVLRSSGLAITTLARTSKLCRWTAERSVRQRGGSYASLARQTRKKEKT